MTYKSCFPPGAPLRSDPLSFITYREVTVRTDRPLLDLAQLLPAPDSVVITGDTSARPELSWTASSTAGVDFLHADFQIGQTAQWQVWAPLDRMTLRFPELPPEYSNYQVSAATPLRPSGGMQFIDFSWVGNWSEAKVNMGNYRLDQWPSELPSRAPVGARARTSGIF